MGTLLVYGAYGFTGELVAEAAIERGLDTVLAGRRSDPLAQVALELDRPFRTFDLADPAAVATELDDIGVVVNCAGPFKRTYEPLVEACIDAGTDYLDITGEISVFQGVAAYDGAATDAGVTLLPGIGFDVVPTDCVAARLAERLPDATELLLGFDWAGRPPAGALRTVIEEFCEGGALRVDGELVQVPLAYRARRIDFGDWSSPAITIPWGDIETAYHTTGIPNIAVYVGVPTAVALSAHSASFVSPVVESLVCSRPIQSTLGEFVDRFYPEPTDRDRQGNRIPVWGQATTPDGDTAVARLETPNSHDTTARSAVHVAERVLDGEAPAGYQTPAGAFGPDLALAVEGVEAVDGF